MIDRTAVFEIHRLFYMGFSIRKISKLLRLDWKTIARYIAEPDPQKPHAKDCETNRPGEIRQLIEKEGNRV